jgi:hypothetical protein
MVRRSLVLAAAVLLINAALAAADGLPVLAGFLQNPHGVGTPDGKARFLTYSVGGREMLKADAAGVVRTKRLPGDYIVPTVAYDASASGLSADGRTLVLTHQRSTFPQRVSRFLVVDARTLAIRAHLALKGDFSLDAISPNGAWVYLIQYTTPRDPTAYRVRALNTTTLRLLPRAIVDPTEPDESMRGNPITRDYSADGRWAYTLYDGDGHPFVHALDTEGLTARCIDVRPLPTNQSNFQLKLDRDVLFVTLGSRRLDAISTKTLTVLRPAPLARKPASHPPRGRLAAALAIIAAFLIVAAGMLLLRRRRSAERSGRVAAGQVE